KPMLALFSTIAVILIALAGWLAGAGIVFAIGLAGFAAHLAWQIRTIDIDDPDHCLVLFKSNRDAGLILFAGLVLDAFVRQAFGVCPEHDPEAHDPEKCAAVFGSDHAQTETSAAVFGSDHASIKSMIPTSNERPACAGCSSDSNNSRFNGAR